MKIRIAVITFVLIAAVAAAVAPAAPAASAPCWKRLVNDWYDGRIDETYPAQCYRDAIDNLPEDVEQYSDAREDIERALLTAIREKGGEDNVTPSTPIEPEPGPPGGTTDPEDGGVAGTTTDDEPGEAAGGGSGGGSGGEGDDGGVIGFFKPANADSVPVPLLVLAGLALLLLAAAAAGFVARRVQARRVPVTPSHSSAPTRELPPET